VGREWFPCCCGGVRKKTLNKRRRGRRGRIKRGVKEPFEVKRRNSRGIEHHLVGCHLNLGHREMTHLEVRKIINAMIVSNEYVHTILFFKKRYNPM